MNTQELRAKAQQCRELARGTTLGYDVEEQLLLWAEEFDAEAEAAGAIESRQSQRAEADAE